MTRSRSSTPKAIPGFSPRTAASSRSTAISTTRGRIPTQRGSWRSLCAATYRRRWHPRTTQNRRRTRGRTTTRRTEGKRRRTREKPRRTRARRTRAPRTRKTRRTTARSEERRVGKEWRSRCDWSSDVCSSDLEGQRASDEGRGKSHEGREREGRERQGRERQEGRR